MGDRRLHLELSYWKGECSEKVCRRVRPDYRIQYAGNNDRTFFFIINDGGQTINVLMTFSERYPFEPPKNVYVNGIPYLKILCALEKRMPDPNCCLCCTYSIICGNNKKGNRWGPILNSIDVLNEIAKIFDIIKEYRVVRNLFKLCEQRLSGAYIPIDLYLFNFTRVQRHFQQLFYR